MPLLCGSSRARPRTRSYNTNPHSLPSAAHVATISCSQLPVTHTAVPCPVHAPITLDADDTNCSHSDLCPDDMSVFKTMGGSNPSLVADARVSFDPISNVLDKRDAAGFPCPPCAPGNNLARMKAQSSAQIHHNDDDRSLLDPQSQLQQQIQPRAELKAKQQTHDSPVHHHHDSPMHHHQLQQQQQHQLDPADPHDDWRFHFRPSDIRLLQPHHLQVLQPHIRQRLAHSDSPYSENVHQLHPQHQQLQMNVYLQHLAQQQLQLHAMGLHAPAAAASVALEAAVAASSPSIHPQATAIHHNLLLPLHQHLLPAHPPPRSPALLTPPHATPIASAANPPSPLIAPHLLSPALPISFAIAPIAPTTTIATSNSNNFNYNGYHARSRDTTIDSAIALPKPPPPSLFTPALPGAWAAPAAASSALSAPPRPAADARQGAPILPTHRCTLPESHAARTCTAPVSLPIVDNCSGFGAFAGFDIDIDLGLGFPCNLDAFVDSCTFPATSTGNSNDVLNSSSNAIDLDSIADVDDYGGLGGIGIANTPLRFTAPLAHPCALSSSPAIMLGQTPSTSTAPSAAASSWPNGSFNMHLSDIFASAPTSPAPPMHPNDRVGHIQPNQFVSSSFQPMTSSVAIPNPSNPQQPQHQHISPQLSSAPSSASILFMPHFNTRHLVHPRSNLDLAIETNAARLDMTTLPMSTISTPTHLAVLDPIHTPQATMSESNSTTMPSASTVATTTAPHNIITTITPATPPPHQSHQHPHSTTRASTPSIPSTPPSPATLSITTTSAPTTPITPTDTPITTPSSSSLLTPKTVTTTTNTTPMTRPFKCDSCPASFSRNHDLKRHSRIHLGIRPFECDVCHKSFTRLDALHRHMSARGCKSTGHRSSSGHLTHRHRAASSTVSTAVGAAAAAAASASTSTSVGTISNADDDDEDDHDDNDDDDMYCA